MNTLVRRSDGAGRCRDFDGAHIMCRNTIATLPGWKLPLDVVNPDQWTTDAKPKYLTER